MGAFISDGIFKRNNTVIHETFRFSVKMSCDCYLFLFCFSNQLQHMAVSCIQRNVRKFMAIREWPWWRLYTKVQPLLNVHRTEEELRDKEVRFLSFISRTIIQYMGCFLYLMLHVTHHQFTREHHHTTHISLGSSECNLHFEKGCLLIHAAD